MINNYYKMSGQEGGKQSSADDDIDKFMDLSSGEDDGDDNSDGDEMSLEHQVSH